MRIPPLVLLAALAAVQLAAPVEAGSAAGRTTYTVPAPVSFTPEHGTRMHLTDEGPYRGTIEVRQSPAGLVVVNELDLDDYVMGIREVPSSWPMEALKAQAVAARTYGLWEKQIGRRAAEGYDVCPTDGCQVYAGASVEDGEHGHRWVEAVRATAGQVLLADGRPALTRYHASSGGQTLPNQAVYGSHVPYLVGTHDPDDAQSPLHSWTVSFPHDVMEAILRAGFGFEGELIGVAANQAQRVAIVHFEGRHERMDITQLRSVVTEHAPRLFGHAYPAPRPDGVRMPITLPSPRFDVEPYEGGFRFNGRGYGHGVGMSQWGAMGRAHRGESYTQILAAYYAGLQPQAWTGERAIRVGVQTEAAEVRLTADGPFTVSSPEGVLRASADGDWVVRPAPNGSLILEGPVEPETEPQVVALQVAVEPELSFTSVEVPGRLDVHRETNPALLQVGLTLTKPARVEAVLLHENQQVGRDEAELETGSGSLGIELRADDLTEGVHRLKLSATSGDEQVASAHSVLVTVTSARAARPVPAATAALIAALATLVAFSSADVDRAIRRTRRRLIRVS